MARVAWKCIKSEVCNLKTMGTKDTKYKNTAFSFLAVVLKCVLTQINMTPQEHSSSFADFLSFYTTKLISCSVHSQLYMIVCDEYVGRSRHRRCRETRCQSVAMLVKVQSRGVPSY